MADFLGWWMVFLMLGLPVLVGVGSVLAYLSVKVVEGCKDDKKL